MNVYMNSSHKIKFTFALFLECLLITVVSIVIILGRSAHHVRDHALVVVEFITFATASFDIRLLLLFVLAIFLLLF